MKPSSMQLISDIYYIVIVISAKGNKFFFVRVIITSEIMEYDI